ncbi:hypothetical protein SAMN04489757_11242 [Anaerocolumna aminovalerica]|uniref:Uncharacterized protein n=1 Tax=Anaerocolumna aminovalerica TaxID=1527 RepID=A0A1I5F5H2_9FIRM|nr:hypothetical protein SAMN04489757_11242 [Anaerocolumna aminovalerica]
MLLLSVLAIISILIKVYFIHIYPIGYKYEEILI